VSNILTNPAMLENHIFETNLDVKNTRFKWQTKVQDNLVEYKTVFVVTNLHCFDNDL